MFKLRLEVFREEYCLTTILTFLALGCTVCLTNDLSRCYHTKFDSNRKSIKRFGSEAENKCQIFLKPNSLLNNVMLSHYRTQAVEIWQEDMAK